MTLPLEWMLLKLFRWQRRKRSDSMTSGSLNLLLPRRKGSSSTPQGYSMPSALPDKFSQQYAGPFAVKRRVGRLAYELELPPHWAVHPVFSVAFLEKYPQEPDPFLRPIPDHPGPRSSTDGKWQEFEVLVEAILDKCLRQSRGKRRQVVCEYLLKWKGYGHEFIIICGIRKTN